MKQLRQWRLIAAGIIAVLGTHVAKAQVPTHDPSRYDVVWTTPSKDRYGSMPIGNGDIGLNVWAEPSGDLLFYIAKGDAVSENSEFLKLGRIRVSLTPNPLASAAGSFRQELRLKQGAILISEGKDASEIDLHVWVDSNRPVIHVEASGAKPFDLKAQLELWRNEPRTIDPKSREMFGVYELRPDPQGKSGQPVVIDPDTVVPTKDNEIVWYYRNERSIYPAVFQAQHLDALLSK